MAIPAAHAGPWTERDLLALPDDGQRYELVEGRLLVSPSPGSLHQWAAKRLVQVLDHSAPADLGAVEAVGVRIPGGSLLIPDVVIAQKAAILANSSALEASEVSLVVEIVSVSSIIMDKFTKPMIYAQAEIPNFWRVDLTGGPAITAFCLMDGSYQEVEAARGAQRLVVANPFKIEIDPSRLVS
jgi:Uma2 family endonuclease